MTKQEFINKLALVEGVSKAKATEVLASFKEIIAEELIAGNEVSLGQDFGTFKPTKRSGKTPGTGNPYSTNLVKFSISAPLKRELNK